MGTWAVNIFQEFQNQLISWTFFQPPCGNFIDNGGEQRQQQSFDCVNIIISVFFWFESMSKNGKTLRYEGRTGTRNGMMLTTPRCHNGSPQRDQ